MYGIYIYLHLVVKINPSTTFTLIVYTKNVGFHIFHTSHMDPMGQSDLGWLVFSPISHQQGQTRDL